jgi:hypothetical protein
VLGIDPAALLHPRGVSEDQLSALAHASATLRHTRLEGDPRQSDGVNAARLLRVAQLLQLAAQWEEATYSRDSDEAQRHIQELQSRLESLERVRASCGLQLRGCLFKTRASLTPLCRRRHAAPQACATKCRASVRGGRRRRRA